MSRKVVELERVSLVKGGNRIVDSVSLQIEAGEFVGILGPNGAGKTSLLNIIAGFERCQGAVKIFGRRESGSRNREAKLRVGYVPQSFDLDPAFPIRALEAAITGSYGRLGLFRNPGRAEQTRALELMELVRVRDLAMRPMGQLSGGERQKVALARALMQEPELLILDEPTASLDVAVQKEVLDLVCRIQRELGLTVIMVTHDFGILPPAMLRTVLMRRGAVIFDGPTAEAMTDLSLSELFNYPIRTFVQNHRRYISYA